MATVSLTEGAKLAGRSKGTLSKAVKSGRLSYVEHGPNGYRIDTSELFRVFPPQPASTVSEVRLETPVETPEDKALRVEVQMLREQLDELRSDRDAWREQAQKLLLTPPPSGEPPRRSFWRFWGREQE